MLLRASMGRKRTLADDLAELANTAPTKGDSSLSLSSYNSRLSGSVLIGYIVAACRA